MTLVSFLTTTTRHTNQTRENWRRNIIKRKTNFTHVVLKTISRRNFMKWSRWGARMRDIWNMPAMSELENISFALSSFMPKKKYKFLRIIDGWYRKRFRHCIVLVDVRHKIMSCEGIFLRRKRSVKYFLEVSQFCCFNFTPFQFLFTFNNVFSRLRSI